MAYERQTFSDGQVLTAKQLNHIEAGVESAHMSIDNATVVAQKTGERVAMTDSTDNVFKKLVLSNCVGGDTPQVTVCGKNLFNIDGVVSTIRGEGSTLNMTSGGYQYDIYIGTTGSNHKVATENLSKLPVLPAGTYTLSYTRLTDAGYMRVCTVSDDGTVTAVTSGSGTGTEPQWVFAFTLSATSRITIRRSVNTAATVKNLQIEAGSAATAYESFNSQVAVPNVPDNATTVDVMATDPTLHGYKPVTTIITDVGATIDVEYVADTKAYIDNKFAELQNAILATGANV